MNGVRSRRPGRPGARHFRRMVSLVPLWASARIWDYENDFGAIAGDASEKTSLDNGKAMNASLASLAQGDTLRIANKTFHLMGGIVGSNMG